MSRPLALLLALLVTAGFTPAVAEDSDYLQLENLETAFQKVVEKAAPSVVGIRAHRRLPEDGQLVLVNGSGTILTSNGMILTNEHVVHTTEDIEVIFHDGVRAQARVMAADKRYDLAILQVQRNGLTPARICNWQRVQRGQWTLVLGNPFGIGADGQLSVSVGVISNLGRELPGLGESDRRVYEDMIQTTAEINPGNSGGPLFNLRGELVGVVTAMHTRSGGDAGAGFAIPMTPARRAMIDRLRREARVQRTGDNTPAFDLAAGRD